MRILLVEDDPMIGAAVSVALKDAAHAVDWVRDGDTAGRVPVVVITARDAVDDRVQGLDLGADDYLVKPFDVNELLARLRAVVRRQGGQAAPLLSNGRVSLNPATGEAGNGAVSVTLSARERALLHTLLLHPGRIFSRAELETHLYGWGQEVESNAVDFLIHGVRRKLGADVIKNVRGAGWLVERPRSEVPEGQPRP
ncbi:MAG: response regulator transcription factor [Thiohalocapsa sp.]|uniref:response regulator transcription factor n=1 Tax=Thiohalocapsa sp. TaxID=2497641 RepID=UPI0025DCAF25|nr:response regulator transcription factor [Thiohalocapsa sp.]MCG6942520.1 response regulator transcription factor [Thiohalocapsa sp.]